MYRNIALLFVFSLSVSATNIELDPLDEVTEMTIHEEPKLFQITNMNKELKFRCLGQNDLDGSLNMGLCTNYGINWYIENEKDSVKIINKMSGKCLAFYYFLNRENVWNWSPEDLHDYVYRQRATVRVEACDKNRTSQLWRLIEGDGLLKPISIVPKMDKRFRLDESLVKISAKNPYWQFVPVEDKSKN